MLVAVMTLSSCGRTSIETPFAEEMPVAFGVYSARGSSAAAKSTKADTQYYIDGSSVTNIPAGKNMSVYAWYHDGTGTTDGSWAADEAADSNIPDFMYDQMVTNAGTTAVPALQYSPVKYWPNETGGTVSAHADKLSFWGYYPYHASGLTLKNSSDASYTNTSSGLPKAEFVVNEDPKDQVDLMFSKLESDLVKPAVDGRVQLKLRHALSLVLFQVNAGSDLPAGATVHINSMSLSNIKDKGTCASPQADISSDEDAALYWSGQTTAGTGTIVLEDADFDSPQAAMLLMPQTLTAGSPVTASASVLTVDYDIVFAAADGSDPIHYNNTAESKLWADSPSAYGVKTWLPGRKYIYKINAGLEIIEFEAVVAESWTGTTNQDVE